MADTFSIEDLKKAQFDLSPLFETPVSQEIRNRAQSDATTIVTQSRERTQELAQEVDEQADLFQQMGKTLTQQLAEQQEAALKVANTQKNVEVNAAAANKSAIADYQKQVNSPEAKQVKGKVQNQYIDAQQEYLQFQEEQKKVNPVVGFFRTAFVEPIKRMNLEAAQRQYNFNQQSRAQATQNFFQTIKKNNATALGMSQEEMAKAQYQLKEAQLLVQNIRDQRTITQEDIQVKASQLQVNESVLRSTINEIKVLNEQQALTDGALNDLFQKMSIRSYAIKEDERMKAVGNQEEYLNAKEQQFQEYLRARGREEEIGKVTYRALFTRQAGTKDLPYSAQDPDVTGFIAYQTYNGDGTPFMAAMTNARTGKPVSNADRLYQVMGQNAAADVNKEIEKRMKETTDPAMKEKLMEEMLNPDNPEDWPKIEQLVRERQQAANQDATVAIQDGTLIVPDMKSFINDEQFSEYSKYIPEDMKKAFTEGEYKDVSLELERTAPAASFNNTMEQMAEIIEGSKGDSGYETVVSQVSNALSGYYRSTRVYSANSMAYPGMDKLQLSGVDAHDSTGWIGGRRGTTTVNLENAGEIETVLLNTLRERRAQRKQAGLLQERSRAVIGTVPGLGGGQ